MVLTWQDFLTVSIVLWLSLSLGVVTLRRGGRLVEKGMVRKIWANYSGLGGSTAASQQMPL